MHVFGRNIPNMLSISRIPIAAAFLVAFDPGDTRRFWTAMGLLFVAIVTDVLDGRIARSYRLSSRTGYFLDGIGDKVVYAAILMVIFREDRQQNLIPWLLVAREIILYALRAISGGDLVTLARLRSLSLIYALLIRFYFLAFFVNQARVLFPSENLPSIEWYGLFGCMAAAVGYFYILLLVRPMATQV